MELITLTSDVRREFGITSARITVNDKDYMVMLKQMSDDYVVFTMPEIELSYGQIIILKFPSKYGFVEAKISVNCFYIDGIVMVLEADIVSQNLCDFFIEFEKFIRMIIEEKKRKEERIICTKKNLERLNMLNLIKLKFKGRMVKAVVKDISFSGIRLLCTELLLSQTINLFDFNLVFTDPDELIVFVNCPLIRKELFIYENQKFAQIVLQLPDNVKLKKRISNFLDVQSKSYIR